MTRLLSAWAERDRRYAMRKNSTGNPVTLTKTEIDLIRENRSMEALELPEDERKAALIAVALWQPPT